MLPSVVATQIRNCVADYLHTTFRPTTPGFTSLIDRFLQKSDNYYKGPYLSIGLPFRPGQTGANIFPEIPLPFHPHLHQEQAFQRLAPPYYQSTLIATGTGSGKTECFLLPLLEHCRQQSANPETKSGIKAILIYPMNALATDQAKRIAKLIHSIPALNGHVTAGLYVGENPKAAATHMTAETILTDKATIRNAPPDILLTNYKMLDYLLIQPDTQPLWRYNQPDTLRYIIVDEFHTFDGAQGTDLACLLRRLKHRLRTPPNHLACVGTSATLGSKTDPQKILDYATTIFNEPFDQQALIQEDRLSFNEFFDAEITVLPVPSLEQMDALRGDRYPSPTAYIRAQARLWLQENVPLPSSPQPPSPQGEGGAGVGTELPSPPGRGAGGEGFRGEGFSDEWCMQLGERLKELPIIRDLMRSLPGTTPTYETLIDKVGRAVQIPMQGSDPALLHEYHQLLLDSLFSLVATARRGVLQPNGETLVLPWVSLQVQYWFRELRRMVASVEPLPELKYSDDRLKSAHSSETEPAKSLPVMHCRTCGATGWGGVRPHQEAKKLEADDLRSFYRAFFSNNPLSTFLFPCISYILKILRSTDELRNTDEYSSCSLGEYSYHA